MQLINKFNKGFQFLLCLIDICRKYAWVVPFKDKKSITITNALQKILDESNRKPNKIWIDKRSEFYNRSIKSWLQDNDMETYSTHNERKSLVAERFITTLKINFTSIWLQYHRMFILILILYWYSEQNTI